MRRVSFTCESFGGIRFNEARCVMNLYITLTNSFFIRPTCNHNGSWDHELGKVKSLGLALPGLDWFGQLSILNHRETGVVASGTQSTD